MTALLAGVAGTQVKREVSEDHAIARPAKSVTSIGRQKCPTFPRIFTAGALAGEIPASPEGGPAGLGVVRRGDVVVGDLFSGGDRNCGSAFHPTVCQRNVPADILYQLPSKGILYPPPKKKILRKSCCKR